MNFKTIYIWYRLYKIEAKLFNEDMEDRRFIDEFETEDEAINYIWNMEDPGNDVEMVIEKHYVCTSFNR